ncbi:hypothetical protein PHJA_000973600 [Phtheirospermum japonicum]|uniref:DUF7963 domain-containing protein n=1 Tax=Phtheirospermum japonicum TaxID=374723 RepID=A0A830BR29_9LAMI|nr:hypothetical protein PHJA_000973600 [Phtheirospermum japonicum]
MADANSFSIDDVAVKAANKRYEGLLNVRTKAVKGKGAWYWAHLEPILIKNPVTNMPKAVKLKCTLCNSVFSASNPSRTASEHLKRGTCPNFSIMSELPPLASPSSQRMRTSDSQQPVSSSPFLDACPLSMVYSSRSISNETRLMKPLVLSGGKDDFGPLAQLENSVKKLKSPKASLPCRTLSKEQIDRGFSLLADWFYESCGSVSFSNLEHPKFKAFLNHLGFPMLSTSDFSSSRLDSKFDEARTKSEAKIIDAAFFQVASDGWMVKNGAKTVKFMVNLPNGTRVFQKAVYFEDVSVPSAYAEEVLWDTIGGICGTDSRRCVGIVADKYKSKALRNLEIKNHWMVNLSCLLQGFFSLIKDFYVKLPLFRTVTENCMKIADFINSTKQIRNNLINLAGFIRVPTSKCDISRNLGPFVAMLDDLLSCSRILHVIVSDNSCTEVSGLIQDVRFWNDVAAAHSLMKMIMSMAEEIEAERPLVGQCLPLWDELRGKVKDWCGKYSFPEGPISKIVETRFRKSYHPAWSAAFILDPLYLVRDPSGKYIPPFECLTNEQETDVEKIIARLASKDEVSIALMELRRWRSDGLDPLYAQAVQVRQRDRLTGKLKIANRQSSGLVWETCLKELGALGKVAVRVIFLHATSCGVKCGDWSFVRRVCGEGKTGTGFERAQKLAFVVAHAKMERRDFSGGDELFESMSGEDVMLDEVLADMSSI